MASELGKRVGFAAVAIPLVLLVVWYGGLPLAALVAIAAALGTAELFDLAERGGVRPARALGIATAATLPLVTWVALDRPLMGELFADAGLSLGALWVVLLLTWALVARAPSERPLSGAGITLLGVAYTGALPASIIVIRHAVEPPRSWAGLWLVCFPLVVTWVCDSAAMSAGRTFGGPKLSPVVSPGKTRSGAVAGVLGALLVAPIFSAWVFPRSEVDLSLGRALVIAAVLSVVGQVGDLAESLFKREAGVKDSSQLLPGHGGILDRLDSLYFVMPVTAAMYRFFGVI
ncbi:MAG TPA: phosphatidate cytidylyltransferase [Gemmatimonadales bacterium]|nr:phosphatidate cytidylyltransferase [Gemmatimonadales bacterium]